MLAAWYGGWGPGFLCALSCTLEVDYFCLAPAHSFWISDPVYRYGIVLFLATGAGGSLLFEQLRRSRRSEQRMLAYEQQIRSQLEAIVNFSDEAMVLRTPDGTITSWNCAAEEMFGYTAEEAIGKNFSMLVPPEDAEREENVIGQALNGVKLHKREAIRMCKDGTRLITLVSTECIQNLQGRTCGVVGITHDITQLKKIEEINLRQARELAAQKSMLEAIIEHSPTAVALVHGEDCIYELVNPAYRQLRPEVEMTGRHFAEVWPEASKEILPEFTKVLETGETCHFDAVGRAMPQGEGGQSRTLWINVSYILLRNLRAPGSKDILVVANDVGGFKRVEDGLRESEERLRLFIEHAPAALAMFDTEMRYMQCSDRWLSDYGLSGLDLKGQCHYDVFPEITEEWKQIHRRGLQGEVIRSEADRFERVDGRVQWIRWEVRPWRRAAGEVGGILIFSEDITERMKFEQQILRLNEELEERVRVRTSQLENSNRELESFAYSVSHDLRAPLRGIDGWTQAFLEDYGAMLDAQARRYLDRVRNEAQHMGHLIEDLLHLSRVSRLPVSLVEVDVSALAGEVCARVKENFPGQKIQFKIEPGLIIRADPRLLEIALTNLIDNAVKFSGKKPESTVEIGVDHRGGTVDGQPTLFVRDNGAGFDMTYAGQLFGAFQRLHAASDFPGTGIGLATVQRIMMKHGGSIRAESKPGNGATFYFTLGGGEDEEAKNHAARRG